MFAYRRWTICLISQRCVRFREREESSKPLKFPRDLLLLLDIYITAMKVSIKALC